VLLLHPHSGSVLFIITVKNFIWKNIWRFDLNRLNLSSQKFFPLKFKNQANKNKFKNIFKNACWLEKNGYFCTR